MTCACCGGPSSGSICDECLKAAIEEGKKAVRK